MSVENVTLARRFNLEVMKLLRFKEAVAGKSKETSLMIKKLEVVGRTKPFVVFELWVQHVGPYAHQIKARDNSVFDLGEVKSNETFMAFGVHEAWEALSDEQRARFWDLVNGIMQMAAQVMRERRVPGLLDVAGSLLQTFV